jgi:hypothetical protein
MQNISPEILINSRQVTKEAMGDSYEFILNAELRVIECVKVESKLYDIVKPIQNVGAALDGLLFELNHVRVNPKLDNTIIIDILTTALKDINVRVTHRPKQNEISVCFKPLGEISDNVRFYLNGEGKLIFLSTAMRPRLIRCNNH